MKKFLLQCAGMLALLLIPVIGSLFLLSNFDKDGYILANVDKRIRLDSVSGPKLVLIGGSNLAFGLNCQVLADSLSFSPVNMGLHASIGLHYMMDEVEPFLKSGDVLLIVPEYDQFTDKIFYGEQPLEELLLREQKYNSLLTSWRHCSAVVDGLRLVRISLFERLASTSKGAYSRSHFNIYGDNTGHWALPAQKIVDTPLRETPQENIVKQVATYIHRMEKRGVKCYVFPPVYKKSCALRSDVLMQQTIEFLEKYSISFQVPAERYVFNDYLFYDTVYHLNKKGVDMRTGLLLKDLQSILAGR